MLIHKSAWLFYINRLGRYKDSIRLFLKHAFWFKNRICRFLVYKLACRLFALRAIKSAKKSCKSDKNIQKSDDLFANRRSDFWPIFTHSTCVAPQDPNVNPALCKFFIREDRDVIRNPQIRIIRQSIRING